MSYWSGLDEAMVGRILRDVSLNADRDQLTLTFADGSETYATYGDCCSDTWVEHLTVPPDIDGATVTGVKNNNYDGHDATPTELAESAAHREYIDVLTIYQSAIVTDRGEVVIEYRNNSNGYYGGSLQKVGSR